MMKQKTTLLFSLLVLLFTYGAKSQSLPCDNSVPVNAILENEACGSTDNDDCNNAQEVSCGDLISGTSYMQGSTVDADWYKFTIADDATVTVTFNSSKSFYFSIIDNCTDQNVLAVGVNDPCVISTAVANLTSGTYYINVFPSFDFINTWSCDDGITYAFTLDCSNGPSGCTLDAAAAATDPSCGGLGDDGSISLIIIDGQPFYDVQWDNGESSQDLYNLTSGVYCYTVTDGLGCTVSDCVTLNPPACNAPQNVHATSVSNLQATINWDGSPCALKYRVQIRKQGEVTWTTYFVNAGNQFKTLYNLSPGTAYQCRVRAVCSTNGSVLSPFSALLNFSTSGCETPSTPSANVLSSSEVEVFWTVVPGVTKYRVRYREVGATSWNLKFILHPQSSTFIGNLTPATTYEYQIAAVCTDATNLSNFTPINTFTTNALRLGEKLNAYINLYPNPTSGNIVISVHGIDANTARLEIYDVLGRQLSFEQVNINEGEASLTRDYSNLAKGVYFVRFSYNGITNNIKFIKE